MEKISWKQVRHSNQNTNLPHARWGHSCCIIQDEVIFFGGYADSNYMNDLWSFNTITMEWKEIQTTGDIPSHRSNCSMNYDQQNHRIILFGGGGPNKIRYNSINILDWKSKEWIEISPKTNQPAPWERTYHTAQLFFDHLIIFGGEGIGDLEDLWIFNFKNLQWTEVPIPKQSTRPCARRFHSSAIINNQFFVIAGCYAKYRCLSDIYSLDLSSFIQSGKVDQLRWKQRKMKDNTFLTRWGHTSAVYQDKIFVFGGRFCNDLSDILILDPSKDQVTVFKISGEIPKARRRHSACFLGNSMLIFGGFNGQYFNDLHYLTVKFPKIKLPIENNITLASLQALKAIKSIELQEIQTKTGQKYQISIGLLIQRFNSIYNFDGFIREIDGKYQKKELQQLLLSLYRGYGKIDLSFAYQFGINIYESYEQYLSAYKKSITMTQRQVITINKRAKQIDPVILLDEQSFSNYIEEKRIEQCYFDITLNVNDQAFFRANKALLATNSQYFACLFTYHHENLIKIPVNDVILFETLLNYLTSNFVVASKNACHTFWSGLLQMAEYFSLEHLVKICENELLSYVSEYSCEQLLILSLKMNLLKLGQACSEQIIKKMINSNRQTCNDLLLQKQNEYLYNKRQIMLKNVYNKQRFDILQKKIETQDKQELINSIKKDKSDNGNYQQQKQNNQIKN